MAHPDHDQVIGSLVAAQLRGVAARGTAEPCPDAETWAAYVDGGLPPAEAAALEAHLAACAACRRFVAMLVPEGAGLEAPAAPQVHGGAVVLPFPRRQAFTWMAAAAGVLMAVTIWSVSRLSQQPELRTADEGPAMAAAPEPARAAAPPPNTEAPAAAIALPTGSGKAAIGPRPGERERRAAPGDLAKMAVPSDDRASAAPAAGRDTQEQAQAGDAKRTDAPRQQANAQPNVARPHGPLAASQATQASQQVQQEVQRYSQAPPAPVQAAPAAPSTTAPAPGPAQAGAAPPAAAPAAPPPPATADAAGQRAGGTAAGGASGRLARAAAPANERPSSERAENERKAEKDKADADAAARSNLLESVSITGAGAAAMPSFAEPGGRLRWRIADNGRRIESSSDGGTTWNSRHTAPRGQRLRAGTAPDISSAWAVGDRGLVLRLAVPGGWTAVASPAPNVGLVAVSAASADEARATAADGRVFVTRDGGATWQDASGAGPQ